MKKCFKCNIDQPIENFYKHARMSDGHLNKCKVCAKKDAKIKREKRVCLICNSEFLTHISEIKSGDGIFCSRKCWYEHLRKNIKRGKKSHAWKGGKYVHNGYQMIYSPEHPRSSRNMVPEHILVMEKHIGRYLNGTEVVHHIDQNKLNNKISNLILFPNTGAHTKYHHMIRRLKQYGPNFT